MSASPDVVLVTGAAGAIGSAAVDAFLGAGFHVVGLDRDPAVTRRTADRWTGLAVDLEDGRALRTALDGAREAGRLRHVVGVAGGALPEEAAAAEDPGGLGTAVFRASVEANLTSQYALLQQALPWLRASGDGDRSVTLTSSFNALSGQGMPAYSAAKAGVIGMMRALVGPMGREGIRINVVAPGTIRTPRTERIWAHVEGHFEQLAERSALGRLGEPADVANAFLALATLLTHVTGEVLVVDGGQLVARG